MEVEETRKSPYHGMWVIASLLVAVPAAIFGIIFTVCNSEVIGRGGEEALSTAAFFSGLIGVLFDLMLLISGVFAPSFQVTKTRLKDFFADLSIGPKLAFKFYFSSMATDGVVFLIYLTELLATAGWFAYGTKIAYDFVMSKGGF